MSMNYRADEPGSFHHVISRAVEGKDIFRAYKQQRYFIEKIESLVEENCFKVHAWVLMSNHFHLLLEVQDKSLSYSMQRLLCGFAMYYNRSMEHCGHVFQGRYRSILVEKESYFLELVRYIHLNPLRAHIVNSIKELDSYSQSGHSHITGRRKYPWQTTDLIRTEFSSGEDNGEWFQNYIDFLQNGSDEKKTEYASGSYLIGRKGVLSSTDAKEKRTDKTAVRVLGSESFARKVCRDLYGSRKIRIRNRADEHEAIRDLMQNTTEITGIPAAALRKPRGSRRTSRVRRILVKLMMSELYISQADTARYLGIADSVAARHFRSELDPEGLIVINEIKRSMKVR